MRYIPTMKRYRPTKRDFYFTKSDGVKYPSMSSIIRKGRVPDDPAHLHSWAWALNKVSIEDLWLVIPIDPKADYKRECNVLRASIYRTATSLGIHVTSQYVAPTLYFKVLGDE